MLPAALLLAVFGASAEVEPAASPVLKPLAGEAVELKTEDGWDLKGVWRSAREGKPTLLLLHGTGQRKEDWRVFARALERSGLGYMAVDLRGHGASRVSPSGETLSYKKLRATKEVNDFSDMPRDVEAAVSYLTAAGVSEEDIGIVGAEVGSSIGVKYAAVHPKVPFVVMLSPGLAWQEIPLVNAVRAFKGREIAILMVHSEKDKRSSRETPLLHAFAKNAVGERNVTLFVVAEERGTRLVRGNRGLAERLIAWIEHPVAPDLAVASTEPVSGASSDTFVAPGEEPVGGEVSE